MTEDEIMELNDFRSVLVEEWERDMMENDPKGYSEFMNDCCRKWIEEDLKDEIDSEVLEDY